MSSEKVKSKTVKKSISKAFIPFERYIRRVLMQVHPECGITSVALEQLNSIVNYFGDALSTKAISLTSKGLKDAKTVTSREVQFAVLLLFPRELARHAISEGTKAVTKYNSSGVSDNETKKTKISRSARAGLQFSPARCERFFSRYDKRIGAGAPIYLAAVLEYITAEILELAGNATRDDKKVKVKPRHIYLGMVMDEELHKLMIDLKISIPGSGVIPNIDARILPAANQKRVKSNRPPGSKRRLRPGTGVLRDIRSKQKQSNCVYFGKLPFSRFVRELAQDYSDDSKFSENSLIILQLYIESYLVDLLDSANKIALSANRVLVKPSDIQLVRYIRSERA